MAPFATMILALPALLLEGNGILEWFGTHPYPWSALIIIFSSGVLAFCLNFSIFYVIHSTTAVTFNVAGNLKVRFIMYKFKHHGLHLMYFEKLCIIPSSLHEMRFSPFGLCFILA